MQLQAAAPTQSAEESTPYGESNLVGGRKDQTACLSIQKNCQETGGKESGKVLCREQIQSLLEIAAGRQQDTTGR